MELINLFGFKETSAFLLALPMMLMLVFMATNTVVTFVRQMWERDIVISEYLVPKSRWVRYFYIVLFGLSIIGYCMAGYSTDDDPAWSRAWVQQGWYIQHWLQMCGDVIWFVLALATIAGIGYAMWRFLFCPFHRHILVPIGNFFNSFTISWK